jgi:hypothetical protein
MLGRDLQSDDRCLAATHRPSINSAGFRISYPACRLNSDAEDQRNQRTHKGAHEKVDQKGHVLLLGGEPRVFEEVLRTLDGQIVLRRGLRFGKLKDQLSRLEAVAGRIEVVLTVAQRIPCLCAHNLNGRFKALLRARIDNLVSA